MFKTICFKENKHECLGFWNRSNNEKIGSILKTYGVAKVGDLPASKYEAFLTDLSAI